MFENLSEAIYRELYKLNDKYASGAQMSGADLQDVDKMAHALKCLATYEAMKGKRYSYRDDYDYRNRY